METVIREGNPSDQGSHICPQCGKKVLIDKHFGDPPGCPGCNIPYNLIPQVPKYF